jgi:hypothetical protein
VKRSLRKSPSSTCERRPGTLWGRSRDVQSTMKKKMKEIFFTSFVKMMLREVLDLLEKGPV